MLGWLKRLFDPCRWGCHRWSMPGGWCEDCGMCDTFFGGHAECGQTCRHWEHK
jgi:hypothetical protein